MPLAPPSSKQLPSPDYGLATGFGLLTWNTSPIMTAANIALTSRTLYAIAVPTIAGQVYTGVKLITVNSGTSTVPTGFYVGLASQANIGSPGTMLAQSANLNASASLTTGGLATFPFNAQYAETATGIRMVLLLEDGAFAGTAVTFARGQLGGNANQNTGQQPWAATAGTAVTAFAANGQAVAANYAFAGSQAYFVALY